jgi:hypothetical protein
MPIRPSRGRGRRGVSESKHRYTLQRGRRMQVRRAAPGLLTPTGERTFLAHLAATAHAGVLYAGEDETNAALHKAITQVEKRSARDAALKGKSL